MSDSVDRESALGWLVAGLPKGHRDRLVGRRRRGVCDVDRATTALRSMLWSERALAPRREDHARVTGAPDALAAPYDTSACDYFLALRARDRETAPPGADLAVLASGLQHIASAILASDAGTAAQWLQRLGRAFGPLALEMVETGRVSADSEAHELVRRLPSTLRERDLIEAAALSRANLTRALTTASALRGGA